MGTFWSIALALVVVAIVVIAVLARLYRKATRETSLIRTGIGGQRVIMTGGAIALPYFHEITEVNMRTLRLEVVRSGEASLITKDRLRVDIGASFALAVEGSEEGVAVAARTLGDRTFNADKLKDLVEGKLVDALRAVAARMTLDELHEGRTEYAREVRALIADDIAETGLRLQSVSLTALDQTPFRDLDENNAFNAVGMRRLAEVIATSKKDRARIDAEADVAVRLSAMEATRKKLQIEQDEEQARIAQVQEIEQLRAAQSAEIARRRAASEQAAERARIDKERELREAEIARERQLRAQEIERDLAVQRAAIDKDRDLELARQAREIAVAEKSEEESRARTVAELARAETVKASEFILTTRLVAEAERDKQLALLGSQQRAEADAERIRVLALAERGAAIEHAAAHKATAEAEAEATRARAEARRAEMLAEAEGERALNDARNALEARIVDMQVDIARLETLPKALAEIVRPAEKIESIRIHQIGGLSGVGGGGAATGGERPAVNQALESILGMAVQLPALKKLGEELGLSMEDGLAQITGGGTKTDESGD